MSIKEQLEALENTRKVKTAELGELAKRAADTGETMSPESAETFDTLEHEINVVEADIKRLRSLQARNEKDEAENMTKARPVDGSTSEKGAQSRSTRVIAKEVRADGGIAMAQVVRCLAQAQGSRSEALNIATSKGGSLDSRVGLVLKAAVAAGTTSNSTWAKPLVGEEGSVYADFIEFLRPNTILGQFGSNGIPALRNIPFRTPLIGQTSGGEGYWTGEGKAKGLTKFDFVRTTLEPLKVANIAVLTDELVRSSSPSADALVRDQLVAALRNRLDTDFIDPTKAAGTFSPASITNGVVGNASSGNDGVAIRNDIKVLLGGFLAANNAPTNGVFIMSSITALALSLMTNPLGQPEFANLTMAGGTFNGFPVIVSEYVPNDIVILVNASDIYIGDEGGFSVDYSRDASLEMDTAPGHSSDLPAAAELVSMFQTNSVAIRAEREINWTKRRQGAVNVITAVAWGDPEAASGPPGDS